MKAISFFEKDKKICPWCRKLVSSNRCVLGGEILKHCGKTFHFNNNGMVYKYHDKKEDVLVEIDLF